MRALCVCVCVWWVGGWGGGGGGGGGGLIMCQGHYASMFQFIGYACISTIANSRVQSPAHLFWKVVSLLLSRYSYEHLGAEY